MRFGTKMMIAFIVLLSLAFGIGGSMLISATFSDSQARARESAMASHMQMLYYLSAVNSGSSVADYEDVVETLEQFDSQGGKVWSALRLLDSDGHVIYKSRDSIRFDNTLLVNVSDDIRVTLMTKTDSGLYLFQISGQFTSSGETFYFEGIYDITNVYTTRDAQQTIYQRIFIAVVVLGALVSWMLSLLLTRPLRKLSSVTRTIASGDLSCRAEVSVRDEIGVLADDFNFMTDKLEENIRELTDAMQRQEEFMGGFAHELKTPMTSIIGYADLLRGHRLSDDDRRDAANYIFSESQRLEALSLKLLDIIVMKQNELTLEPRRVAPVIVEVIRLMKPVLVKNKINIYSDYDDSVCLMDTDLIKSLLINIIDNSRKAIGDKGGEIIVDARTIGDNIRIRVADNGRGIPAAELSRITDAFYRVDKSRARAQGGVGLGLSLCLEIAELHGGSISFESYEGKGTRVTVLLRGATHETDS